MNSNVLIVIAAFLLGGAGIAGDGAANGGDISIRKSPDGSVQVDVGGKLFARLVAGEMKPYLWPILLDATHMTRHFPMEKVEGEKEDHVHQRSLWFTHGDVNGVDFWAEEPAAKKGRIVQREVAVEPGPSGGCIRAKRDWLAPDGKKVLGETSTYRFRDPGEGGRFIDIEVVLEATEGPVKFGDTKEGTFGIRLNESLKETRGGRMVNSRGGTGMKECWGKPAEWVDYTGKIDGKTFGVAIFDHPSSFRHPTTWHVRDYGLFAANPFGLKDFTGDKRKDGSHTIAKGESLRFRYGVLFHRGTTEEAKVAERYGAFAK